jgi:hypothetical protein
MNQIWTLMNGGAAGGFSSDLFKSDSIVLILLVGDILLNLLLF